MVGVLGGCLGWFGVVWGHRSGSRSTAGGAEGVVTEFARCWLRHNVLDTWLKILFWPKMGKNGHFGQKLAKNFKT